MTTTTTIIIIIMKITAVVYGRCRQFEECVGGSTMASLKPLVEYVA